MKITPKHLDQLKIQILAALANNGGQSMVNQYAAADFSTDWLDGSGLPYSRQKAFCFDLFYAADLDADFVASLYDYLNDSHIYTALQAICPAIPDGNGPSISSNPQCIDYDEHFHFHNWLLADCGD